MYFFLCNFWHSLIFKKFLYFITNFCIDHNYSQFFIIFLSLLNISISSVTFPYSFLILILLIHFFPPWISLARILSTWFFTSNLFFIFWYYLLVSYFLISLFFISIFIILFFLLALGLICFYLSSFLMQKLQLLVWDLFIF